MANGRDFFITVHMKADFRITKKDARRKFHNWLESNGHTTVASGFDLIETLQVVERGKRIVKKKRTPKPTAQPDQQRHTGEKPCTDARS